MRFGWLCAATVCMAALGTGRAAPAGPRYAAISGVVLDDATGAPVPHAIITLSTVDAPLLEAVTLSEASGAFGFTEVPPAKYRLSAACDGFQSAWFGAATAARAPGVLTLAAGDIRYGITFRLRPVGSISGVVYDPDGEGIPNVQLRLLKAGWSRRKPAYETLAFTGTDDRGHYRFSEVLPGRYLVMATQPYNSASLMQPEVAVGQPVQPKAYGTQFYPDAMRVSAATPIEAAPGQDVEGIDLHLTARAAAPLRGRVDVPDDLPSGTAAMISVYPQDLPDSGQQTVGLGAMGPKFEFAIENLVPGIYLIDARLSDDGHEYRDVERIELQPGGQEITLHPERAGELAGRVDLEGGNSTQSTFKVSLVPGGYPPGRNTIQVETRPDGTFVAKNVSPGVWDIDVAPIPKGGYIKAMRLGDQDVLTEDMNLDAGPREPLHIVIGARGAVVSGTVTVPSGISRSARSRVLLAPSGKYADVVSFYAADAADDSGHFEFKGVTPGRYKLYAFEEMEPSAYDDPNFLKPYEASHQEFAVGEGEHVERQTQLIPKAGGK